MLCITFYKKIYISREDVYKRQDIGHPTGKVNEFIKENFQVDLLNIKQENKINFNLQM